MQNIIITGNLTKDPETRVTNSGASVTSFTVAAQRSDKKTTDFFRVNAWKGLGDVCHKYLAKGRKVLVVGELQARLYESKGKTGISLDVLADKVEFLSQAQHQEERQEEPTLEDFAEIKSDDLPF